jgi:hypothetical protein
VIFTHIRSLAVAMTLLAGSLACHSQDLASLDASVRSYTKTQVAPSYRYVWVQLGDGSQPDALVLLGGDYCGSAGCNLLVLRSADKGLKLVSSSTISNEPIGVLNERQHGLRTLIVNTRGKGEVLMRFNGSRYPLNPSMQPTASKAQTSSAEILKLQNRVVPGS